MVDGAIERISDKPLDAYCDENIFAPLGMSQTFFHRHGEPLRKGEYAATERCEWRRRVLYGEVHDENAFVIGGVAGHSGLFGTASSVHRLLCAVMAAYAGNVEKALAGTHPEQISSPVFDPALVRIFLKQRGNSGRALGFDMPSAAGSSSGDLFSRDRTVGHLGFTGTSFWMDLRRSIIVILLTNRIHPSRSNEGIRVFRRWTYSIILCRTSPAKKKNSSQKPVRCWGR